MKAKAKHWLTHNGEWVRPGEIIEADAAEIAKLGRAVVPLEAPRPAPAPAPTGTPEKEPAPEKPAATTRKTKRK